MSNHDIRLPSDDPDSNEANDDHDDPKGQARLELRRHGCGGRRELVTSRRKGLKSVVRQDAAGWEDLDAMQDRLKRSRSSQQKNWTLPC